MQAEIEELQIKITMMEHTVEQLNAVITNQDFLITKLTRRMELLEQQLERIDNGVASEGEEPPPPHY
jgi:uncharacterized coiled-coil protein SlyX